MPMPTDVKQVRALMGGINYYRMFLPDLSKRLRPINSRPPRHADGTREGFDGGLSCHSAFLVSPPPRHTGGTRQVFDGWFSLLWCLRFLQLLFFAFFLAS